MKMNEKLIDLGNGVFVAIVPKGQVEPEDTNEVKVDAEIRLCAREYGTDAKYELIPELVFRDKCAEICGAELTPYWGNWYNNMPGYRMRVKSFYATTWIAAAREAEIWALTEVAPLLEVIALRKAALVAAGPWIVADQVFNTHARLGRGRKLKW